MLKTKSIKRQIILTISYTAVVVPTLLVALLATTYYYLGIEKIFSEKITESIHDTVEVAGLYLNEHNNNIKTTALMAANEIGQQMYSLDKASFMKFLDEKANSLGLSEIVVFTSDKKIIGSTSLSYSLLFEKIEDSTIAKADEGLIMVRTSTPDKVQALLRLDLFMTRLFMGKVYILVGRYVDSNITQHLAKTQEQADIFLNVKDGIDQIRRKVIIAFLSLSTVFLLLAIFISEKLASFILKPIHDLSEAIKKFKLGGSVITVREKISDDEINILARSFNKMIATITSQHSDIVEAKQVIEDRNHFIEAMMSELSAGVIVLNRDRVIEISNLSALRILGISVDEIIIGSPCNEIIPECAELVDKVLASGNSEIISSNINIVRRDKYVNLLIKVQLLENHSESDDKIIIIIDDISAIVSGQRFKAWADIARRLAHEIKNPLTPIQLAIDRLDYKFKPKTKEDRDLFKKYIEIVNNRVEDIKRMLAEFVEFSGISTLKTNPHDIEGIINDVIFLQKHQWPEIKYQLNNNAPGKNVLCEKRYMTQVITNLLKNSAESIMSSANSDCGEIKVSIDNAAGDKEIIISIEDNGTGINPEILDRICEPYVTTKSTGTGLGLSIVKKIIEEHKSDFVIQNKPESGTIATFRLKIAISQ